MNAPRDRSSARAPRAPRQRRPSWLAAVAVVAAACASDQPAQVSAFDSSSGRAVVTLHGDGFAALDGERLPLETVVLRLRFHARDLGPARVAHFVVKLTVAPDLAPAAQERAGRDTNRLMAELDRMDVTQVELF